MENGRYNKVDFSKFIVRKFVPHIFSGDVYAYNGCGSTAISILSGISPFLLPNKKDWTSNYMTCWLRNNGFEIARLTRRNVTNCNLTEYPINKKHVLLIAIKFKKYESSWIVVHSGRTYHNFEIGTLDPMEFVNHPIMDAYLVKHHSWDETENGI